jgi:hypothetical protein
VADDIRAIVERMVAAGESEDNIAAVIKRHAETRGSAPSEPQAPPEEALHPHARVWQGLKRILTDPASLPTGGAMGGALTGTALGGPIGGVIGAGLGGALGKGGEIMAREARGEDGPESVGAMAGDIATRGGLEALAQGAGGLIGAGLQKVARPVYNLGLNASKRLKREHADLAKTGINNAIAVSRRGTDKAERLRNESSTVAKGLISDAEKAGAPPVRANEVIAKGGFGDLAKTARKEFQAGSGNEIPAIAGRMRTIRLRNRSGVPVTRAQELKSTMQAKADKVYRAAEKPGGAPPTIDADMDKATAQGFQRAIEARVPKVRDVNKRTRSLGGLTEGLEDAGEQNHVLRSLLLPAVSGVSTGMSTGDTGTGLQTAGITAALTAPGNMSRAAIGMDRMGKWGIPAHALRAAIMAMLNEDEKK